MDPVASLEPITISYLGILKSLGINFSKLFIGIDKSASHKKHHSPVASIIPTLTAFPFPKFSFVSINLTL